jgi:hypothetical protein
MKKFVVLLSSFVIATAGIAHAQEVVITDFPLGVGSSIDLGFFRPHEAGLKAIADSLGKYPHSVAVITGGADGVRFRQNNDAKNPGLALGRAHALRNFLVVKFKVDSAQLLIQTNDVPAKGAPYRSVSIRVVRELTNLQARLDSVANQPPIEKHYTEIREVKSNLAEHLGLQIGLGVSTSPFGGIPIAEAAVTWKQIVYVEGVFGYTFWNGTFRIQSTNLSTRRRLAGGHIIVYPWSQLPIGLVGGWTRIEEISQQYYQYVKLSEGPELGVQVTPLKFLSVRGVYNPSKQRVAGQSISSTKNGQFLLSVAVHKTFGGAR